MANPPSSAGLVENERTLRAQLAESERKLAAAEHLLAETQEVIRAIHTGEVDAVVVSGPAGEQVFTLQGAEHAYRELVEAMNEGAATLGPDGAFLYCNQHLSGLLKVPLERMIGSRAAPFFRDGEVRFDELFDRALAGEAVRAEMELHAGEGRVPVSVSLRRMEGQDPTALCLVVTDLTQSKRWEEQLLAGRALQESRDRLEETVAELRATLEVTPAIIFIARDPEARKMVTSRAGYKLLRLPEGANVSLSADPGERPTTFRAVRNGLDIPAGELPLQQAVSTGQVVRDQEFQLVLEDGAAIDVLGGAAPLFDQNGRTRGAVAVFMDVTEKNRTERALRLNEKLAAAGRLAASVSHEINNPLEAVGNLLYLINLSSSLEEAKEYARVALDQLGRVGSIVKHTLRFYRQSSNPTDINLQDVLESVLALNRPRFGPANIEVVRRYRTDHKLRAYDGELRHVFANLIGNAFDAMKPGGRLFLGLREITDPVTGARGLRASVADTGQGMDRTTAARIFEPFFSTKGDLGTGLGLWMAQSLVRKHGGKIRVRSRTDAPSGTIFSVFLPFGHVGSDAPPLPASTASHTSLAERFVRNERRERA